MAFAPSLKGERGTPSYHLKSVQLSFFPFSYFGLLCLATMKIALTETKETNRRQYGTRE